MRVMLRAGFDRYSGYGNDAVDIARFMQRAGVDVTLQPIGILPGLPRELTQMLEKDPSGRHDAVLCFAPPFDVKPIEFASFAPIAAGYSMWEKSLLQYEDMLRHGWDERSLRLHEFWAGPRDPEGRRRSLDVMFVTCQMNVAAFQHVAPEVHYEVVPCGIDADEWPEMDRAHDGPMTFGMIGMLAGRKDPFTLLQAWKALKDEIPEFDARLELKTSCAGLHPKLVEWYPDVVLHDRAWPRHQLVEWYRRIDVLVSTSRGEGNNKPAMEFMSTGGPVMATDWSGHQNWLHPEASFPLRGQLMSIGQSEVQDFRVDVEHLKEQILFAWQNPAEVARRGKIAASLIRNTLTWEKVVPKLLTGMLRTIA